MNWTEAIGSLKAQIAEGKTPSVEFNTLQDIKDFVDAIKQESSFEGIKDEQLNMRALLFTARWGLGAKQLVSLYDIVEGMSLGVKVFFNSEDNMLLFAAISDWAISDGVIKESDEEEDKVIIDTNTSRKVQIKNEEFSVDNRAERILDSVASAFLVFGWIGGLILIIAGIVIGAEGGFEDFTGSMAIGGLILGAILIAFGYVVWATLKVVVNISNNLYRLNKKHEGN